MDEVLHQLVNIKRIPLDKPLSNRWKISSIHSLSDSSKFQMPLSNIDPELHWFGDVETFPIHDLLHYNECSRGWPLHKGHGRGECGHAVH